MNSAIQLAASAGLDPRVLPLAGKPRELLQALIALGGRGVRESALTDALWPDADGDAARRVLNTTLHRLRRQLGDERTVRLSEGRLDLDERRCWADVVALDHCLMQSEREIDRGASTSDLARLAARVLALYRGPLLAELEVAWVGRPRQETQAKFLRVIELLGRALERGGAYKDAILLYQSALERVARAEELQSALIRCTDARRLRGPTDERRDV